MSYTVTITNAYKAIGIRTTDQLHIGRIHGANTLDIEEVNELDERIRQLEK